LLVFVETLFLESKLVDQNYNIEKFFEDQKKSAPYWVDYGIRGVYIKGV